MKTITYLHGKTRQAFTAFPRQGVIYGVIVRQSNTSTSSLYVPVSTYTEQDKSGESTVDWNSLQVTSNQVLSPPIRLSSTCWGHGWKYMARGQEK